MNPNLCANAMDHGWQNLYYTFPPFKNSFYLLLGHSLSQNSKTQICGRWNWPHTGNRLNLFSPVFHALLYTNQKKWIEILHRRFQYQWAQSSRHRCTLRTISSAMRAPLYIPSLCHKTAPLRNRYAKFWPNVRSCHPGPSPSSTAPMSK